MSRERIAIVGALISILIMSMQRNEMIIPVTWNMDEIKRFHLLPPDSMVKVNYAPEEYYYSLPEHIVYKTFPVYVKEFEKRGYIDSLRSLSPKIVFDKSKLKTEADWIRAGELVFNWPAAFRPVKEKEALLDSNHFRGSKARLTRDGILLSNKYIAIESGLVMGSLACASCHTRILESGEIVPGAQGNISDIKGFAEAIEIGKIPFPFIKESSLMLYTTPWAPTAFRFSPDSAKEIIEALLATPSGVIDRQGTGYLYPVTVPSLIGIKDIKYLDHTGLMKHDGPGDMMRYAAFNQGMDLLNSYNDYMPGGKRSKALPATSEWNHPFGYAARRYSEEQLYALTKYIYSLKPPKNPNHFPKELVASGQRIFSMNGCATCHTPPLYTNNKLTPASGFKPPASHFKKYDIFNVSVETDSVSALYTRRGTGYYKIPSLRGVWYRGAFFHNGNLTSLEEVLDKRRLQPDYIPTGFKPPYVKSMPVKGHPFGLDLDESDKKALIAFLKTL